MKVTIHKYLRDGLNRIETYVYINGKRFTDKKTVEETMKLICSPWAKKKSFQLSFNGDGDRTGFTSKWEVKEDEQRKSA
jgi:hypothetical protein